MTEKEQIIKDLEYEALQIRKNLLRLCTREVIHIGGDLSIADAMTVLWQYQMKYNPKNPKEDHNVIGGLGSVVANVLAEEGLGIKFKILGLTDKFVAMAHAPFLCHQFEYNTEGLVKNMMQFLIIKDFNGWGKYNCRVVYNDTYIFNKSLCASSFAEAA